MTNRDAASLPFGPLMPQHQARAATVSVLSSLLVLWYLGELMQLLGLVRIDLFTLAFAGGSAALLSTLWWQTSSFTATIARRLCIIVCLCLAGVLWVNVYGSRGGTLATTDYLVLVVLTGLLLGPDLQIIWRSLSAWLQQEPSPHTEQPLRSWLGGWLRFAITVGIAPVAHPYTGWLGAFLLLAVLWCLWIVPSFDDDGEPVSSRWRWGFSLTLSGSFLTLFLLLYAVPFPRPVYGSEVVYTSYVSGQAVTLQAQRTDAGTVYTVLTKKALIHSTVNAYRQAEVAVHPAMNMTKKRPKHILVLGSEDGATLREIQKYKHNHVIYWMPLFSFWREFFDKAPLLRRQRIREWRHSRVKRLPAMPTLDQRGIRLLLEEFNGKKMDLIIADFPKAYAKNQSLFSQQSASLLLEMLKPEGRMVLHLTSAYMRPGLFWCLVGQWARMNTHVVPFHLAPSLYVDFGMVMISRKPLKPFQKQLSIPVPTRYLYRNQPFSVLANFAKDVAVDGRYMTPTCKPWFKGTL